VPVLYTGVVHDLVERAPDRSGCGPAPCLARDLVRRQAILTTLGFVIRSRTQPANTTPLGVVVTPTDRVLVEVRVAVLVPKAAGRPPIVPVLYTGVVHDLVERAPDRSGCGPAFSLGCDFLGRRAVFTAISFVIRPRHLAVGRLANAWIQIRALAATECPTAGLVVVITDSRRVVEELVVTTNRATIDDVGVFAATVVVLDIITERADGSGALLPVVDG